jgi:hypothetical protein
MRYTALEYPIYIILRIYKMYIRTVLCDMARALHAAQVRETYNN